MNLLIGGIRIIAFIPGQVTPSSSGKSQWDTFQRFDGLSLREVDRLLEGAYPVDLLSPPASPLLSRNIVDLFLAAIIPFSLVEHSLFQ